MLLAALTLLLAPWIGHSPATVSADAIKFALIVHGRPNARIGLASTPLPAGWVASFCTNRICSPLRYTIVLNASGRAMVEFQAVRTDSAAPHRARVRVLSGPASTAWVELKR